MRARHVGAVGRRVFRTDPPGAPRFIGLSPARALRRSARAAEARPRRVAGARAWSALTPARTPCPAGGFIIFFVAYVLAASALVRERTSSSRLERMLVATPSARRDRITRLRHSRVRPGHARRRDHRCCSTNIPHLGPVGAGRGAPAGRWRRSGSACSSRAGALRGQIFTLNSEHDRAQPSPVGLLIPFGKLSPPLQVLGRLVPLTYPEDVLVPVFRDGQPAAEPPRLPRALFGALRRRAGRRGQPHPEGACVASRSARSPPRSNVETLGPAAGRDPQSPPMTHPGKTHKSLHVNRRGPLRMSEHT